MKLPNIVLLLFLYTVSASAQFGPAQYIDITTASGGLKQHIRSADLVNDGLADLVVGSDLNGVVRIFHNIGSFQLYTKGHGSSAPPQ